jgi:hypothetical protein
VVNEIPSSEGIKLLQRLCISNAIEELDGRRKVAFSAFWVADGTFGGGVLSV